MVIYIRIHHKKYDPEKIQNMNSGNYNSDPQGMFTQKLILFYDLFDPNGLDIGIISK